jgi:hypothetical protein
VKTLAAIPCHDEGLAIGSVVLKARKYVEEVPGEIRDEQCLETVTDNLYML